VRVGQASLLKLDDPNFSNHIAKNTVFDVLQKGVKFQIENASYSLRAILGNLPREKCICNLFPFRIIGKRDKKVRLTKFADPRHGILVQLAHSVLTPLE